MKLLFNFTNNGNDELKELIGHIDADFDFDKLKSDIISATTDMIKLIGAKVYDDAVEKYEASSTDEADLYLIYRLRYPIALEGYRHHAKASDVSHSKNGRRIRVDDKNKVPFDWMLDRDNEILERKYYKAVDDLLDYLEADSTIWKASDAYQSSQKYYVRLTSDFDEFFPINSRLLLTKLKPGISQCERKHIAPTISATVNDTLKSKLKANTALTSEEETLLALIKEACVFYALAWGMRTLRVTLFPEGVLQRFTSDRRAKYASKPSEKLETELAAQEFLKRANEVLTEIQQSITVSNPTIATPEILDSITTPNFKFNDCDNFASL